MFQEKLSHKMLLYPLKLFHKLWKPRRQRLLKWKFYIMINNHVISITRFMALESAEKAYYFLRFIKFHHNFFILKIEFISLDLFFPKKSGFCFADIKKTKKTNKLNQKTGSCSKKKKKATQTNSIILELTGEFMFL